MSLPSKLFIDGAFCGAASGKMLSLTNPATEEILGEVASGGERDIDAAVLGAQHAYEKS